MKQTQKAASNEGTHQGNSGDIARKMQLQSAVVDSTLLCHQSLQLLSCGDGRHCQGASSSTIHGCFPLDASFLLTIEVFLLVARPFLLTVGGL